MCVCVCDWLFCSVGVFLLFSDLCSKGSKLTVPFPWLLARDEVSNSLYSAGSTANPHRTFQLWLQPDFQFISSGFRLSPAICTDLVSSYPQKNALSHWQRAAQKSSTLPNSNAAKAHNSSLPPCPAGTAPAGFIWPQRIEHLVFSTTATGWLEGSGREERIQRAREWSRAPQLLGSPFRFNSATPPAQRKTGQGTMTAVAWQRDVSPGYWELHALHEIHNSATMSSPTSSVTSTHRAESPATVFNQSRKAVIPSASTATTFMFQLLVCCHKSLLKYSAHFCEYY